MKLFETYKIAPEHDGLTVEIYLKQILQYSGRKIQKLTRKKGLFINGKPAYLQRKIKPTDTLRVLVLQDASYGVEPEQGQIEILYEDEFLLVLNKPAHQLVHPTGRTSTGTLANFLAFKLKQRGVVCTVRPIHRLDRETSGCVIFAKDAASQHLLEQQLQSGTLKRTYQALVKGLVEPPTGTIDARIGEHPHQRNQRAITPQGEPARTHYTTLQRFQNESLLELTLETGRTHQIRLHLAHLGYPIIGDGMYGVRSSLMARQALHAVSISFVHLREKRQLLVNAPLPNDFARAVEALSKTNAPDNLD
ncbi:Ribosomal large subunit pseudouridine synthase D [bioreactor metagenome]|uniref:Ribosomal large subunit pseudouridine synthase D n=1 Tax=bioreactor metagenome TaxID=1076179 RepID=A0A644TM32_9ZZZZ